MVEGVFRLVLGSGAVGPEKSKNSIFDSRALAQCAKTTLRAVCVTCMAAMGRQVDSSCVESAGPARVEETIRAQRRWVGALSGLQSLEMAALRAQAGGHLPQSANIMLGSSAGNLTAGLAEPQHTP